MYPSCRRHYLLFVVVILCSFGCSKPPMLPVQGVVKLDGKPVGQCKVGFFPDTDHFDTDRHGFGFGITNDQGEFTIQHPQGEMGIWAGDYKVTFVAWVDSEGQPLSVDTKPSEVEGGVINRFSDIYEAPSTTTERVTIKKGAEMTRFEFNLSSKPL